MPTPRRRGPLVSPPPPSPAPPDRRCAPRLLRLLVGAFCAAPVRACGEPRSSGNPAHRFGSLRRTAAAGRRTRFLHALCAAGDAAAAFVWWLSKPALHGIPPVVTLKP